MSCLNAQKPRKPTTNYQTRKPPNLLEDSFRVLEWGDSLFPIWTNKYFLLFSFVCFHPWKQSRERVYKFKKQKRIPPFQDSYHHQNQSTHLSSFAAHCNHPQQTYLRWFLSLVSWASFLPFCADFKRHDVCPLVS